MFEFVISPSTRSFGALAGGDVQVGRVALDHLLEQRAQVDALAAAAGERSNHRVPVMGRDISRQRERRRSAHVTWCNAALPCEALRPLGICMVRRVSTARRDGVRARAQAQRRVPGLEL